MIAVWVGVSQLDQYPPMVGIPTPPWRCCGKSGTRFAVEVASVDAAARTVPPRQWGLGGGTEPCQAATGVGGPI